MQHVSQSWAKIKPDASVALIVFCDFPWVFYALLHGSARVCFRSSGTHNSIERVDSVLPRHAQLVQEMNNKVHWRSD